MHLGTILPRIRVQDDPVPRRPRQRPSRAEGPRMEARYLVRDAITAWQVRGVRAVDVAEAVGCMANWSAIERRLARWWIKRRVRGMG